ncbi:MAG: hypothetical protein ING65_15905 [Rhodocyclaceae bacterium]|nr:hypothetical protein [Rhodocyclaceae bacterium]
MTRFGDGRAYVVFRGDAPVERRAGVIETISKRQTRLSAGIFEQQGLKEQAKARVIE